jgi:hypothetical protein
MTPKFGNLSLVLVAMGFLLFVPQFSYALELTAKLGLEREL